MEANPYLPPKAELIAEPEGETLLASRGKRFLGALVDGLLQGVVLIGVGWATGTWEILSDGTSALPYLYGLGLGLAIFLLLNGMLLRSRGQTIGKLLAGTQIVSAKDEQILSVSAVFLKRYLPLCALGALPVLGWLISLVDALVIFREDRRCLHDHLAGTKVVLYPY